MEVEDDDDGEPGFDAAARRGMKKAKAKGAGPGWVDPGLKIAQEALKALF